MSEFALADATEWESSARLASSPRSIRSSAAYRRIIGMGLAVVPLILREMEKHPGNWFLALLDITGENPVQPEDEGNVSKMAQAWLRWGMQKGYL